MKKIIKSFVAVILSFSIGFTISIQQAYAFDVIGAASLVVTLLQTINAYDQDNQARRAAEQALIMQWSTLPSTTSNMIRVSSDDLYSACFDFTRNGMYCEVATVSIGGLSNIKVIRCVATPYSLSDGTQVGIGNNFVGKYFAPTTSNTSDPSHLLYAVGDNSSYSLDLIRGYIVTLNQRIQSIMGSVDLIESYVDNIDTSTNTIIGHIDGIESSLNTIIGHIDGIESSLSSIDTKFTTLNSRIIKTVNGSTYTIADLGYNAWQRLIDISGYVDGVESSLSSILSANNLTNTRLSTIIDRQDTSQQTLEGIYDALYEINDELVASNLNPVLVSSYLVDSEGDDYPRVTIPYESAVDIIGYLNDHFYSRRVSVISNSGSIASRWFVRADLSENNYIRVYCSAQNNSTGSVYGYYLCDSHHNIIISANPTYLDKLNNLDTKVTQLTGIISPILGLAAAVANIDLNVGELNLNLDSLFDDLNLNLDDLNLNLDDLNLNIDGLSDSISALPSSNNIIPYIDQLESYTDGLENALSTINSNVTYTSDGITYSVGYLSYVTADYSKKIYDHLSNIDIADDSHIMPLIENYSDVVLDTFGRGERTIQLFTMGWGDYNGMQILPRQWSEVVDWFDMYNEGSPND